MTQPAEKRAEPTPGRWMLHNREFATVVTAQKPGRPIALCDSGAFSEEENVRHAAFIAAAPDTAAERDQLMAMNAELVKRLERYKHCRHGGVDCFCTEDAVTALALFKAKNKEQAP